MSVLPVAAEITGQIQQLVERLHQFRTYELSSSAAMRHRKMLDDVHKSLTDARNEMAGLSLILGKENL